MKYHGPSQRLPAAALALALSAATSISAQQPPASIRTVTHYTVKSERAGDMAAAIKEYNDVLKKARYRNSYTIWRSATGPANIARVDLHLKWSELDQPPAEDPQLKEYRTDLVRIAARINESFSAVRRVIEVVDQDLSLPRPEELPNLIAVARFELKPGKLEEVRGLAKEYYLPALKGAGSKSFTFAQTRFGGAREEIYITRGMDGGWASLDQPDPIAKAMGDEKYHAFSEKMMANVVSRDSNVYRLDKDLSYTAPK